VELGWRVTSWLEVTAGVGEAVVAEGVGDPLQLSLGGRIMSRGITGWSVGLGGGLTLGDYTNDLPSYGFLVPPFPIPTTDGYSHGHHYENAVIAHGDAHLRAGRPFFVEITIGMAQMLTASSRRGCIVAAANGEDDIAPCQGFGPALPGKGRGASFGYLSVGVGFEF
jgi:hypothetical protein